jgi:hypothetical protein
MRHVPIVGSLYRPETQESSRASFKARTNDAAKSIASDWL